MGPILDFPSIEWPSIALLRLSRLVQELWSGREERNYLRLHVSMLCFRLKEKAVFELLFESLTDFSDIKIVAIVKFILDSGSFPIEHALR